MKSSVKLSLQPDIVVIPYQEEMLKDRQKLVLGFRLAQRLADYLEAMVGVSTTILAQLSFASNDDKNKY